MVGLDDFNSELFKRAIEKIKEENLYKTIKELDEVTVFLKKIEPLITAIEKEIKSKASFLLTKTNFYKEDFDNYLLVLHYMKKYSKNMKLDSSDFEGDFNKLIKEFRKKKKPIEYETFAKYIEYTCIGDEEEDDYIGPTCGEVFPGSSKYFNLQKVSIDMFLKQFNTFNKADKELKEMFLDNDTNLMTALSSRCSNDYDGDWDNFVNEEMSQKNKRATEKLKEEERLCSVMKGFEEKYNVKIQLMFRAYREYLK